MQRTTRNTFMQKGAEVQKVDQSGIWAYIVSSYLNPDFDSACHGHDVIEEEDKIISVAKWIYRCKRLLRKSKHVIVSIDNGEILEPCYLIEPSSEARLQDKTLVWLEPLPQLNGYLIIPGGLSQCEGYDYGSYGSYGSGSGLGYGSGSGIIDCNSLLNCLCVQKNSQGKVTGVFIRKSNGSLVEVGTCPTGSGSGGCCPPDYVPYAVDYDFTVNGESWSGTSSTWYWNNNQIMPSETFDGGFCNSGLVMYITLNCLANGAVTGNLSFICTESWSCILQIPDDLDVVVYGCPGNPTFYVTIKPGRCASGYFVVRPA